jgi:hypothetical protein
MAFFKPRHFAYFPLLIIFASKLYISNFCWKKVKFIHKIEIYKHTKNQKETLFDLSDWPNPNLTTIQF